MLASSELGERFKCAPPHYTLGRLATFLVGQNTRVHVRTKQWTNEGSSNLGGLLISRAKYVDNNPSNQQTYKHTNIQTYKQAIKL
jgi:hypothetical protein